MNITNGIKIIKNLFGHYSNLVRLGNNSHKIKTAIINKIEHPIKVMNSPTFSAVNPKNNPPRGEKPKNVIE